MGDCPAGTVATRACAPSLLRVSALRASVNYRGVRVTAPALLTEAEAAEHLRVCARTLRRLRQNGAIRYVAITSRTVAYRQEDLQAFIEQRTQTCDEQRPTRRIRPARQRQGEVISFSARRAQRKGAAA